LNHVQIYKIILGFSNLNFKPHYELLYKLEPYILRDMFHFGTNRLLKIASLYLRNDIGNNEILLNIMIKAINNEQEANVDSLINLLKELNPSRVQERQFKVDMNRIIALICKSLIGKLNQIRPKHLVDMVRAMQEFGIGNLAYNEIMSIELTRNID
jgi:hypothetical protein